MSRGEMFPSGSANVVLAGPGRVAHLPERAWHLSDWPTQASNQEGAVLAAGWADFQEPEVTHQFFNPAQYDGAVWLGAVADPRAFSLPVMLHRTATKSLERVRDDFFDDLGHHQPARLYVNSPSGTTWLDIRMNGRPEVGETRWDEAIAQEQDYLIPVVSEQGHFQGTEVARTWVDEQGWQPGPELWNYGDLPEWPVWTLRGPGVFTIPDIAPRVFEGLEAFVMELIPDWIKDLLRQGGLLRDNQTTVVLLPGETMVITGDPNRKLAVSDKRDNAHRLLGGQRPLYQVMPHERWDCSGLRVVGGRPGVTSAVVRIDPRRRRPW